MSGAAWEAAAVEDAPHCAQKPLRRPRGPWVAWQPEEQGPRG